MRDSYAIRSKVVHGADVRRDELTTASQHARSALRDALLRVLESDCLFSPAKIDEAMLRGVAVPFKHNCPVCVRRSPPLSFAAGITSRRARSVIASQFFDGWASFTRRPCSRRTSACAFRLLAYALVTAKSSQSPGTPLSVCPPRDAKPSPEPATKSLTVCETRISPVAATAATRAPIWTAMPPTFSPRCSHSPV